MRVTHKDLETRVKMINSHLGITGNVNHFELEYAYEGVRLVKTCSGGGVTDLSTRMTNREMWNTLCTLEDSIIHLGLTVK